MMTAQGDGLIGRTLGGYTLEAIIGRGTTGAVYRGRSAEDGQTLVAVKVLQPPLQVSPAERAEFDARFRREADILRHLQHPHIMPLFAAGEDAATGYPYMVLPLMAGTLADRAGREPLAWDALERAARQIADALDYAHHQGVIHRDIKPANILVDAQGDLFLADFGVMRLFDAMRTSLAATGQALGTPNYIAPEQITGKDVGPAADRYSFAIVLYQLLTAHLPFAAENTLQVLYQQAHEPPAPPRQFRPDLTSTAEAVLLQALAKDPAQRFTSATLFVQTLFAAQQSAVSGAALTAPDAAPAALYAGMMTPDIAPADSPRLHAPTPDAWPRRGMPNAMHLPISDIPTHPPPLSRHPSANAVSPYLIGGAIATIIILLGVLGARAFLGGSGRGTSAQNTTSSNGGHTAGSTTTATATATIGPTATTNPALVAAKGTVYLAVNLTGPFTPTYTNAKNNFAERVREGVATAIAAHTNLGNGYSLALLQNDDSGDISVGLSNFQSLAQNRQILGVVGPYTSPFAAAAMPYINTHDLVDIGPTNGWPGLTDQQWASAEQLDFSQLHPASHVESYFTVTPTVYDLGRGAAGYAFTDLGKRRAFVAQGPTQDAGIDPNYDVEFAQGFRDGFMAAGGTIAGSDSLSNGSATIAQQVINSGADVVAFGGADIGDAGALAQTVYQSNPSIVFVGGNNLDGVRDTPWAKAAGAAAGNGYGIYGGYHPANLAGDGAAQQFTAAFEQHFYGAINPPSPQATLGYDAAMVEIQAIQSVIASGQPLTQAAVRDAVARISYAGIDGRVSFNHDGGNTGTFGFSIYRNNAFFANFPAR